MFGLGENNQPEAAQPPNEFSVRLRAGLRAAAIGVLIAGAVMLGIGLIGSFMAGGALLSSGPIGWLLAAVGIKSGAAGAVAGSVVGAVMPYVLGALGVVAAGAFAWKFSDDRAVLAANDEFNRTQQQEQLQQLERSASLQRQRAALARQAAENERHAAARGTLPGELGAFMPPSHLPIGGGNGGGGRGGPGGGVMSG